MFQLGVAPEWASPTLFFGVDLVQSNVSGAVRSIAERVSLARGLELVEVELKRERAATHVRVFLDKEGGIGLEDLQSVSEEVSAILDAEDPISEPYTLEVSSPGLDRPLKGEADYRRFIGSLARLSSYELIDARRHWTGRIQAVENGFVSLSLENEGGALARIPVDKISHGRLEVEFPAPGGNGVSHLKQDR
jgi:ribosome maturation factor RimP